MLNPTLLQPFVFPGLPSLVRVKPRPSSRRPRPGSGKSRLVEVSGFGRNPGDLRMLEYMPPQAKAALPLVVVLHGCFQNAEDFDRTSGWSSLARKHGFALLYPEQKPANNANLCFNWFRPSLVTRDRGELGSIREMIDACRKRHPIDDGRIFVMGLSAGGAMASALLATYPELFAAGAIICGLPFGAARDAMTAMVVMKKPPSRSPEDWSRLVREVSPDARSFPAISVWHGSDDEVVSIGNAEASLAQWQSLHGVGEGEGVAERIDSGIRRQWRDEKGRMRVELIVLDGFRHGLPVGKPTAGKRAANDTARFMLPGPVSAPEELVRSWGLA